MQETPLQGLRIVECGDWSSAFAARLLADGGASVVRVVPPSGDPLDAEAPFFGDSGVSIQATWYNAGKQVVQLDVSSGPGRGRLLELIAAADILLEGWRPGSQPVTDAEIEASRPGLVRVSVSPAGRDANPPLVANDLVYNALSGAASVTGTAATPPINGYGNQTYHTVGLYAAVCGLAALRAAQQTGQSQHVDLSSLEALVSCTEQVLMEWFFQGNWTSRIAPRQGSLHWSGAYEVYPDRKGQGIMVSVALRMMEEILPWMKEQGLAQDLADPEKFPDVLSMVRNLPYVMKVVREWVAANDAEEMFYESQERRLPFGVVWDVATALRSPQIEARGYLQPADVPGAGTVQFPGRFFLTDADGPLPGPARRVKVTDLGWDERPPLRGEGGPASATAPLAGVRILDFTHVLAGPFGTRVLGDLGADVLKMNTAARAGGANNPGHPYYICWNRNKRCISLDLAQPDGRRLARQLAEKCDVITENFSAGVLRRWGLDRASLAEKNPGITVVAMAGMGNSGPWKDFVTFAPTIHALTGLTWLTNPPGEHLLGYGFSLTDHLSGLAGALAVLEGLEHRRRTGQGLEVDLSQYELGLGLMAPALMDHLANGVNPEPMGNRHPFGSWAPHGIYRAAGDDRWVAIAVRGDHKWQALCGVLGREELSHEPRFATHDARLAHQDELDAAIEDWTRTRDRYEVMRLCQTAGIAAGAVQDARDLTENDPYHAARQFFGTADPVEPLGAYGLDRFPALFNGKRPERYEAVHQLGADTFDVLSEVLQMPDEEIAELMARGVLS